MLKKIHPEPELPYTDDKGFLNKLRHFALVSSRWTERWVPEAWVLAVILSIIVFLVAVTFGNATVAEATNSWGKGLWVLLPLMAQFTFAIVVASVCANVPITSKALNWLGSRTNPDKPWQAIALVTIVSFGLAYINWAFCLLVSATFVPYVIKHNPKADKRLLVVAAYTGMATLWHAGISGVVPLLMGTPNNFLLTNNVVSELIPVTRTLFTAFNLLLILVTIISVVLALALLTPKNRQKNNPTDTEDWEDTAKRIKKPADPSPADHMVWWPGWNIILGCASLYFLIQNFKNAGIAGWTIDTCNLLFLTMALFLSWRPIIFLECCKKGIQGAWGIIVQFPLYGGIFGLISYTELGHAFTSLFTSISTKQTFLPIVYWYSGFLSYFIPSGGSKWAIEAPYLLKAAQELGISPASTVLAYTWGDMSSHLIQPFWAIPLLDITKTKFGQIAGYCAILFLIYLVVISIFMFFMPTNL
ncbi:TIGR00366 family protein [Brevibacillus reuszeri]|uniref:TIGR00366 family protein n=1 Tax=Brevibacillus reuszeri TaxID=54915 RepID=UPI003D22FA3B